jgi:hypothetical protein
MAHSPELGISIMNLSVIYLLQYVKQIKRASALSGPHSHGQTLFPLLTPLLYYAPVEIILMARNMLLLKEQAPVINK